MVETFAHSCMHSYMCTCIHTCALTVVSAAESHSHGCKLVSMDYDEKNPFFRFRISRKYLLCIYPGNLKMYVAGRLGLSWDDVYTEGTALREGERVYVCVLPRTQSPNSETSLSDPLCQRSISYTTSVSGQELVRRLRGSNTGPSGVLLRR